jgi:hypothetical protein
MNRGPVQVKNLTLPQKLNLVHHGYNVPICVVVLKTELIKDLQNKVLII